MTARYVFDPDGPTAGPGEPHEWHDDDTRIPISDIPEN